MRQVTAKSGDDACRCLSKDQKQSACVLNAILVLRQDYDKQGGQRAKKEGRKPPKEAAAIFGLSQSGVNQRESAPANEKLGVLHFCIPFFQTCFFVRQTLLANQHPTKTPMNKIKLVSKFVLAVFLIFAGLMHFVRPEFFLKIMPPYLPFPRELVLISGAFEIMLGASLWIPRLSRIAAWGVIALMLAVFPANIYLFQHQEILPAPPFVHLLRLPMQAVFILWAYWHTRLDHEKLLRGGVSTLR
jgi:uncharacterized membrane protein